MKMMKHSVLGIPLWVLAVFLVASTGFAVQIASSNEDFTGVEVMEDVEPDGSVSGVLTNRSDDTLKDVRLLIRHAWHWKNEFDPGEDDPGRASYVTLPDSVPPGGTVVFEYVPEPSLPNRDDGHFETEVQIVGLTRLTYPE